MCRPLLLFLTWQWLTFMTTTHLLMVNFQSASLYAVTSALEIGNWNHWTTNKCRLSIGISLCLILLIIESVFIMATYRVSPAHIHALMQKVSIKSAHQCLLTPSICIHIPLASTHLPPGPFGGSASWLWTCWYVYFSLERKMCLLWIHSHQSCSTQFHALLTMISNLKTNTK